MRLAWPDDASSAAIGDIATPSRRPRLPGLAMAGFRATAWDTVEMSVVPYPAVTLFLDFGDALRADDEGGSRHRGSVAMGLVPRAVLRGRGGDVECLQIRLAPALALATLGIVSEIGGAVIPFADLWGAGAVRLEERLRAATSWDERFAIAECALGRRLEADRGRAADPEVAFAWRQMARRRGGVRIARLAAETGWSRKQLWSRFRSQIGVTPKRAAQLIRFDYAAHRLAAGDSPAEVAAAAGYTDQSHLHRDTASFTGLTPAGIASAPWLAVDPTAWNSPGYLSPGPRS